MNIQLIIELLNRETGGNLSGAYYARIREWEAWWRGCYRPFHQFRERSGPQLIRREMYTLGMAKKVCEDWASLLLNEQTRITVGHRKSSDFLQGKDGQGGVLGQCDFWHQANTLVEKAFMSGTGAMVLRLGGVEVRDGRILPHGGQIGVEFLSARNIIPLTVQQGKIREAAFVSETLEGGERLIYLETHTLGRNGYVIRNRYFKEENGELKPRSLPQGMAREMETGSDLPLFSILRPVIVNNVDEGTGLGLSIFANAIDCLKGVDLCFNNFCRDFKLGGKKVFLNQSLTARDADGTMITPDDVAQQLFMNMGDNDGLDAQRLIHEFNPSLRVEENTGGLQAQLDYLSFKCGLGTRHYQFERGEILTATQYMGDRQELVQNAAKHGLAVRRAVEEILRAILWAGREALGMDVRPDCPIAVILEDGYLIDRESQRERDREEVQNGLMRRWEYRMRWYGETEAEARKAALEAAQDLQKSAAG